MGTQVTQNTDRDIKSTNSHFGSEVIAWKQFYHCFASTEIGQKNQEFPART